MDVSVGVHLVRAAIGGVAHSEHRVGREIKACRRRFRPLS